MKKLLLSSGMIFLLATQAMATGIHDGGHDQMAAGMPGKAQKVDRTIKVTMIETEDGKMLYEPRTMTFKKGETIRMVITNKSEQPHEFVLDSAEKNAEHKTVMTKFPEMEHDDPNALRLDAGAKGTIVWTFANSGTFEYACLIPGHYESGMFGPVKVN